MENIISLTPKFMNRLNRIEKKGIKSIHFSPTNIDWIRNSFSISQNNNHVSQDSFRGLMRLINDPSFVAKQKSLLERRSKEYGDLKLRFLVKVPKKFPMCDELRDSLKEIQSEVGLDKIYLPVGKSESFESISQYVSKLKSSYVLVLDLGMSPLTFSSILNNFLNKTKEIVIIYNDWKRNMENFTLLIESLEAGMGNKFHVAGIPLDITHFGKSEPIAPFLICSGIKSISLDDTPIPGYMFKHIDRSKPPKTKSEKIEQSVWVDSLGMGYSSKHPENCNCINDNTITKLMDDLAIKEVLTYHNLEWFSKIFSRIRGNPTERKKMLELEPLRNFREAISLT